MRGRLALSRLAAPVALALVASGVVACGAGGRSNAGGLDERASPFGLACPHDAVTTREGCRCAPGLFVLEGACVGRREVDAYCGSRHSSEACGVPFCANGEPFDLASGRCASARTAREIFAHVRPVPSDLQLGCHEGRVLVVLGQEGQADQAEDGNVACLLPADTCPRSTAWDPHVARCAPVPSCPPGALRAEAEEAIDGGLPEAGPCVRVVRRGTSAAGTEDHRPIVDVGQWTRVMLGANGGEGTSRLCRPISERPWELDIGPGGARTLALTIELRFPDNDVTQVSARVDTVDGVSRLPLVGTPAAARQIERATSALLAPLRALGGAADAASATIHVRCTVRGGSTPMLFPRSPP
jgi:hypothetical protein